MKTDNSSGNSISEGIKLIITVNMIDVISRIISRDRNAVMR